MEKNEAQVTVTGWLNDVKDFEWGRAIKVGVDVRKKNDQDEWETVDKTVYDCTTDDRTPLDEIRQVRVVGRITGTNVFQKRDGSNGFSIKVRADSVVPLDGKTQGAAVNQVWPGVGAGKPVDEGAPF